MGLQHRLCYGVGAPASALSGVDIKARTITCSCAMGPELRVERSVQARATLEHLLEMEINEKEAAIADVR